MSRQSMEWLHTNVKVGFGHQSWHFSSDSPSSVANHYPGAIPMADARELLERFPIVRVPLSATMPDGSVVAVPGRIATADPNTGIVHGVFSDGYAEHQHTFLAEWAEQITDNTVGINSLGVLDAGAVAFLTVSLADTTVTAEGIEFLPYLMLFGSANGRFASSAKRVITNVVCDNTMGTALGEKTSTFRVKHTRNSGLVVADAREALELIVGAADDFTTAVAELCATTVTDREFDAFLDSLVPIAVDAAPGRSRTMAEGKRESLLNLWRNDRRVSPWKNTAYGVIQAVNTHATHIQTVRGADRAERNMMSTLSGDFDTLDASTLNTLNRILVSA